MLGYAWSYNTVTDKVVEATYGEDGYDKDGFYAQLDVKLSDEKGIVTATLDADADLDAIDGDESHNGAYIGEEMGANVTVDVLKLFGLDTDFSLKLTGTYNDRVTGLRAYKTAYGFGNADRIRTLNGGNPLSIDFAYGKLVQARVAYVPSITTRDDGNFVSKTDNDFLVSALVNPIDGVKVSAGYVYDGSSSASGQSTDSGAFNVAVDVDIAALADLDFDLGVSASYVGLMANDYDDYYQTIAAVVYGGIDVIDGAVEFVYFDYVPSTDGKKHYGDFALSAVANINAVEGLPITVYFAICDFDEVADSLVIGATVEYEVNGVGLGVALEYVGEKNDGVSDGASAYGYYDSANYATGFKVPGFSIALHSTLHHMHQKGLLGLLESLAAGKAKRRMPSSKVLIAISRK